MASISGRGSKGHHTYKLTLTEASQSIPSNVTTINYVFDLIDDGNWWWGEWNTKIAFSITANGTNITSGYIPEHWEKNQTIASGSFTVSHNTDGTKSISFGFSVTDNANQSYTSGNASANGTMALTTIPRYLSVTYLEVTNITETTVIVRWSVSNPRSSTYYSLDNGTTWVGSATYGENLSDDGQTGLFDILNLTPNTNYNLKVKFKRTDSGLWTESDVKTFTTYDYPKPTSMNHFVIGNGAEINMYNPLNRTYTLDLLDRDIGSCIGTYTGAHTGIVNAEFRTDWAIQEQYKSIPNKQKGGYIARVTCNGVERTLDWSATYSVKGTEVPTINGFDYIDNKQSVVNITGNNKHIVQNQSELLANVQAATPNWYAGGISQYYVECNGKKTNGNNAGSYNLGTIDSARDVDLTLTVVDSRGLSASKTIKVSMLAHSEPSAIVTLQRLNNYEDETYLTVDGSISSVNGKNSMAIQYRYKQSGGSYGAFTTIGDRAKQTLSLDKNNTYIFNVVVTDAFGSRYDKEYELGKGVFPLFIDTAKNSVGINKFPAYDKSLEANGLMVLGNRKAIDLKVGESVEIPIPLSYSSGLVNIGIAGDNLEASRLFYVFRSNMYFGVSKILAEEIFGNASAVPMIVSNGDNAYIFKFTNNYSSTIHIRYGILELC